MVEEVEIFDLLLLVVRLHMIWLPVAGLTEGGERWLWLDLLNTVEMKI